MKKKSYSEIKKLIDLWEEYEEVAERSSIHDFAEWILMQDKRSYNTSRQKRYLSGSLLFPEYTKYLKNQSQKSKILDMIARISRFHDFYLRKFLNDLPINTRLEYLFLYSVDVLGQVRKTDIIHLQLVEFTTGMDIIKRLINQGFLDEFPNTSDKRTRLLGITESGKILLKNATKKLQEEIDMFLSGIDENKWKKIIPVLEEIHDFHNEVYLKYNDKTDAELINLVASLKYFYK